MALTLKTGKTYKDPYNGDSSTCYANIKQVNGNANRKDQHVVLEIYSSEEARENGARPIDSKPHTAGGDDWETYFSVDAINPLNKNQYDRAYSYIMSLEENIGTEEEPELVKIYRDWESDL